MVSEGPSAFEIMLSILQSEALVADATPNGSSENGDRTKSWPDYPGETPTKVQSKEWADQWEVDLKGQGYGSLLRGDEPFELKKLSARPLKSTPFRN